LDLYYYYCYYIGLKFGIYSSAGFKTCQKFPAAYGLEDIDAASYAEWGK
jgi:alpha-galactosidase